MTREQERTIERVKKMVDRHIRDGYEIKTWEVDECYHFVGLYIVWGLKDDEGTMASILGRDKAHIFIGKRGGITYPVSKELKDGTWKHYTKSLKGHDILRVVIDQMH